MLDTTGDLLSTTARAPQVRAAEALQNVADAEIDRLLAGRLPSLALEAGLAVDAGSGSVYEHERLGGSYSYGLRLGMPLYEGGRRVASLAAARSDFEAAGEIAVQRQQSAALDLALALADGQRYRAVQSVLSRQESSLERLSTDIRDTIQAAAGSQVDLDDIERQLARTRGQRQEIEFGLAAAEAIAARYGVSIRTSPPAPAAQVRTGDERTLLRIALDRNPRLREQKLRIASAQARVTEAERASLPTVALDAGVIGTDRSLPGVRAEHFGTVGLRMSIPIFDNGVRSASVRRREGERLSAEFEHEARSAEIAASIRGAVMRRDGARLLLRQAESEHRLALSMLGGVREERAVGVRSTFDEIRANEELANAEISIAVARWQELTASYVLATETGSITSVSRRLAAR